MKKLRKVSIAGFILVFVALVVLANWDAYKSFTSIVNDSKQGFSPEKREDLALLFRSPKGQELYLVGTIHDNHLHEKYNYSLQNLQAIIQNVQPFHILIEARQQTIDKHNAIDGPIEMLYIWSYAQEQDIMVSGIDWWQPDQSTQANTTTEMRDDEISLQIMDILKNGPKDETFLVFIGHGHLSLQHERLVKNGFVPVELKNHAALFESSSQGFSFPETIVDIMEKKIEYMQNGFMDEVLSFAKKETEAYRYWDKKSVEMVDYLKNVLNTVIIPDKLFYDTTGS